MSDPGAPIPPSASSASIESNARSIDIGRVDVQSLPPNLRRIEQAVLIKGEVVARDQNGSVTLRTPQGDVKIKTTVELTDGQRVQLRLPAGSPPIQARANVDLTRAIKAPNAPVINPSQTVSPQPTQGGMTDPLFNATVQQYQRPPIPIGSTVPIQYQPAALPSSLNGLATLITRVLSGGDMGAYTNTLDAKPSSLPPALYDGMRIMQTLRTALVGQSFKPASVSIGSSPLIMPMTQLSLNSAPLSISDLAVPPSKNAAMITQQLGIKAIGGVQTTMMNALSNTVQSNGINNQSGMILSVIQPGAQTTIKAPYNAVQNIIVSNGMTIPIPAIASSGISSQLFIGMALGKNINGDAIIMGQNGLVTLPKGSLSHPVLPGTVMVMKPAAGFAPVDIGAMPLHHFSAANASILGMNLIMGDIWPAMEDALQGIQQMDPAFAAHIRASIPNPAQSAVQMTTSTLFFMTALGFGNIKAWMGDRAFDILRQMGRADVISRLTGDFAQTATRAADITPDGWRPMMIPLMVNDEIQRMQFYLRNQNGDDSDSGNGNGSAGKKTRFVVNVNETQIGALQLDGLIQGGRLDIVMRTHDALDDDMRQGIRAHYTKALDETDLVGAIMFESGSDQWLKPDMVQPGNTVSI